MPTFLAKLKCGGEEIDLLAEEWGTFAPKEGGYLDEGELVTFTVHAKGDTQDDHQKLTALLHKLSWFNQMAIAYERRNVREPVRLGMKIWDGNPYDTAFGRGWGWKVLSGERSTFEPAIQVELGDNWYAQISDSRIRQLTIRCRIKPRRGTHGELVHVWETESDRWVGIAEGAVMLTDDGGIELWEDTVNKFTNPDFEYETDPDAGWTAADPSLVATVNTDPEYVWSGFYSMELEEDGTSNRLYYRTINVGNTNPHSLQVMAKRHDGREVDADTLVLNYGGNLDTIYEDMGDGWYRCTTENFAGVAANKNCGVFVKLGAHVFVDAFQLEEKAYCTPFAYGTFGRGHSFSGAAHQSTSVRADASLYYRNEFGTVPQMISQLSWSMLFVCKLQLDSGSFPTSSYRYLMEGGNGEFYAYFFKTAPSAFFNFSDSGGVSYLSAQVGAPITADETIYVFLTYGESYSIFVYREDGTLATSAGPSNLSNHTAAPDTVYIGADNTKAKQWNGPIYDVQVWDHEITVAEMEARVACGRGSGELPFLWSKDGDGAIVNCDDEIDEEQNYVEFDNCPGDEDAGLKLFLTNDESGQTPCWVYIGQQRGAVPRMALPSKKLLLGCHWHPFLEAEAGSASYDGDTSTTTDADASGGSSNNCAVVSPSDMTNVKRIEIPICNEPEDLWKWGARSYRVLGRFKSTMDTVFLVQYRVVTGTHEGPKTPQVYVRGADTWVPQTHERQVVNIPSFFVDPERMQEYVPGDWASDVYCYLEVWVQTDDTSETIRIDGVLLLPNDSEGYGYIPDNDCWAEGRALLIDSSSKERSAQIVHDVDNERFLAGVNFSGHFTLPVRDACRMAFMWRRYDANFSWQDDDVASVQAKYRPRYRMVR